MNEILTGSMGCIGNNFVDEGKYHRAWDKMRQDIYDCFERMHESDSNEQSCTLYCVTESSLLALARKPTSKEVPIWEKSLLTVEEAAAYSGLGLHKIRDLTSDEDCDFVVWNHSKRMIKRKKFDAFLERTYSI